jgi:hypothetical protein
VFVFFVKVVRPVFVVVVVVFEYGSQECSGARPGGSGIDL